MTEAPAAAHLDPERMRRARSYRVFKLTVSLTSTVLGVLVMLVMHAVGAGIAVRQAAAGAILGPDQFGALEDPPFVFAVISVFLTIGWLVQLPLSYVTHARGVREGLVTESVASAFVDQVKGFLLTLTLLGIPLTAWYLVLDRPDWWLLTILGTAALATLGFAMGPMIAALFFRFEPIADPALTERIRAVAGRAGVRVEKVERWGLAAKTTGANAAVMGLGPTKRVVLGDTLLDRFPLEEVESVVAHEVGHQVAADGLRFVSVSTIGGSALLIGLRLAIDAITRAPGRNEFLPPDVLTSVLGASDAASFPLFAGLFLLAAFALRPLFTAYARSRESAADAFGARHTSRVTMAAALVRLADQNLADPEPPRWEEMLFYTHPAIASRVRALGMPWPP